MKQQPRFHWTNEKDDYYICTVTVGGVEVYESGATFPTGGPFFNARTRIAYEQEIWEEYTGEFVA